MMTRSFSKTAVFVISALVIIMSATALAVPPSPEMIQKWSDQGILGEKMASYLRIDGNSGLTDEELADGRFWSSSTALGAEAVDTDYVVVIMVDFSDQQGVYSNASFDSLLFSDQENDAIINATGSWFDFYWENSYGTYYLEGILLGWYRMPQTYAWYVNDDDGFGRADNLVAAAIDSADAHFDFSTLGVPSGTSFRGLTVIHAGWGAEASSYGIWSHRGGISAKYPDGVKITGYAMDPERYGSGISTMGVYAHEHGHSIGLADYYDTNYEPPTSEGLGDWSLMASGSWNGLYRGGDSPAHLDAYNKIELDFITPIEVNLANPIIIDAQIPQVESEPVAYRMVNASVDSWEYWIVENRQEVGFDEALPGSGLCIYHVDLRRSSNDIPGLYKLGLEQADGNEGLAFGGSSGDGGDPFPGYTNNHHFHQFSTPNSETHLGAVSEIGVWDISDSDSLMSADLEINFTRPWIELGDTDPLQLSDVTYGDGDDFYEAGETVEFFGTVKNVMATGYDPILRLEVDHPGVTFPVNDVSLGIEISGSGIEITNTTPITMLVPGDIETTVATFTVTIITDDTFDGTTDSQFVFSFTFDEVLGVPNLLLVDGDNGAPDELRWKAPLLGVGMAYRTWDVDISGSPPGSELLKFPKVLWYSGHPTTGGTLTSADVAAMTSYLDAGGKLILSSMHGARTLNTIAPSFMTNYLHATLDGLDQFAINVAGVSGTYLGNNLEFAFDGTTALPTQFDKISATSGAEDVFNLKFGAVVGNCGVMYNGAYRTLFLSFPAEYIDDNYSGYDPKDTLLARAFAFLDGVDSDSDGIIDAVDNCTNTANVSQDDTDDDGWGDACDICEGFDDAVDRDYDGVPDGCDVCVYNYNPGQEDADSDNVGDLCDNCDYVVNPGQENADNDSMGDACDDCPNDYHNDLDEDGVCGDIDNCPTVANTDQLNSDADSHGDLCDNCPEDDNEDQADEDSDGTGDVCQGCCGDFTDGFTGNTDCSEDGKMNLADITLLIDHVYVSKEELCCPENGNVEGDELGKVNLADITALIDFVYVSKIGTAACL